VKFKQFQFLKNEKFYASPFNIKDDQIKIIHDGDLATYFATDDSEEFFQDWQSLWENQIVNLNIYGNSNILSKINHFFPNSNDLRIIYAY